MQLSCSGNFGFQLLSQFLTLPIASKPLGVWLIVSFNSRSDGRGLNTPQLFWYIFPTSFPHILEKSQPRVIRGQVTSQDHVNSCSKTFKPTSQLHLRYVLEVLEEWISNSQRLIRAMIITKLTSRIFNARDLASGQFMTSSL